MGMLFLIIQLQFYLLFHMLNGPNHDSRIPKDRYLTQL